VHIADKTYVLGGKKKKSVEATGIYEATTGVYDEI